jgi:endonuclease/exonuclease/phosphatase family metal-dependent hydrolase
LFAVIAEVDADVVVLQEATSDATPYTDHAFEMACGRVAALEGLLVDAGYTITRTLTGNPSICCSRLPVTHSENFNLDDRHRWKDRIRTCVGNLTRDEHGEVAAKELNHYRQALYIVVELPIGDGAGAGAGAGASAGPHTLGIYATHLHHVNYNSTPEGVRAAEMGRIVSHFCEDREPGAGPMVIVGDLNQARESDHAGHGGEWGVVGAALEKFDAPQDDGVDALLESNGFSNCFDMTGLRNFGNGVGAPPLTHWTGTSVDHVYAQQHQQGGSGGEGEGGHVALRGCYLVCSTLSDHLPLVVDLVVCREH